MEVDDLVKILGGLGLGAGSASILSALINSYSSKGKSRAEAADLLVQAAERVGVLNKELDVELREVKRNLNDVFLAMFQYLSEEITREELLEKVKELRG